MKKIKNRKLILIIIAIILILLTIFIYFFIKNNNKNIKSGNTISNKNAQEIEEYILNINSFEAKIEVEVKGNKTTNKYKIEQKYISPNIEKQTIIEPSNIQGLETIYDGSKLSIKNSKVGATTVYENYPYMADNFLWLNSFINEYKTAKQEGGGTKLTEENGMIIMEVSLKADNKYVSNKILYINKETGNVSKLVIQDINKKNTVYILYNEIKINSLKKEEILAFRLNSLPSQLY